MNNERSLIEEIADDPLIRMCWMWRTIKIVFYGLGAVGVFIYVVIKCVIDKLL